MRFTNSLTRVTTLLALTRFRKAWAFGAVILIAGLCSVYARQGTARRFVETVTAQPGEIRWEGVGSCSASACHGNTHPATGDQRSAVTTWTRDDPHAQAYTALWTERSKRMVALLRGKDDWTKVEPEKDALCISCHSMPAGPLAQGPKFDMTEGVGCESCHGPAGKWKEKHDLLSWQGLNEKEKAALGMKPLRNAAFRAASCASCHIGDASHEVNHDLIASGHPALFFEVSTQMAKIPKHWDPMIDKQYPDFEARLWMIGQVMGARMSLELLEARAKDEARPWPEFSEYDCLACHKSLKIDPSNPDRPRRGQAPYGEWHQPMTRVLARTGRVTDPGLLPLLDQLNAEMSKQTPNRATVATRARAAITRLDAWLEKIEKQRYDRADVRSLTNAVLTEGGKRGKVSWYEGAQYGAGLTVLNNVLADLDPAHPKAAFDLSLQPLRKAFPAPTGTDIRLDPTLRPLGTLPPALK